MPGSPRPTPLDPISTHPGPAGPRRQRAALVLFVVLLGLHLYALARLPLWPLVLALLAAVVVVMLLDQFRAWAAAQRVQGPRHHRARVPRTRHRLDRRAVLVVETPWCAT